MATIRLSDRDKIRLCCRGSARPSERHQNKRANDYTRRHRLLQVRIKDPLFRYFIIQLLHGKINKNNNNVLMKV